MNENMRKWRSKLPLVERMAEQKETLWLNPLIGTESNQTEVTSADVQDAANRLRRFAPYIAKAFPETEMAQGIIESPLIAIPNMQSAISSTYNTVIEGKVLLKADHALHISGSIKARGGIYEVLKHAETLAFAHGLLAKGKDYAQFATPAFRGLFARHEIAVGSTGNLGLSIGIIATKLGFKVTVHMSADAKQWKKELLREKGAVVVEYEDDYSKAVEEGRRQAESDAHCHFIDDENSLDLFSGYAVAGERFARQLQERGTVVDEDHPLFVYLPCGVGGGPGGVAFGLKLAFGENVHCFFAEPTQSPCMMLGMMTGLHDGVSVHDFGFTNETAADGLAVGRPSGFVGKMMEPILSGCYTVSDGSLFKLLRLLVDEEGIELEPSALAGMMGPVHVTKAQFQKAHWKNATHIVWATGGGMVPEKEMKAYYELGR